MGTINKLSKLVLSFLLAITCINFSIVYAEDGEEVNYTEPSTVETVEDEPVSEPEQEVIPEEPAATEEIIVEKPVAEDPVVEKAAPVEEEKQEETVEPEVQQEAPVEPEIEKVETVEEVKVTVVVSYVDENDHPLTDPITGSYPTEYRLDENVDAFKSFDGYAFEKVIVNDDAKNTISKDDVQKNGLRITKDMTSLKLVYQKMNLESNENKEVIPEVTEEASEEAEPESNTNETELSAFDQTAFAGNVTVHVTAAEGVLPSGAQLIVKRVTRKAILNAVEETVTEKDKEVDSAIALDITIVNADGIEIQPNGIVNVSFENVAVGGEEVNIYHVTDDASTVTEVATNTQSFDANHFSIYVITRENPVELTTFNFVADGNTVSTQIVKTGDTLITPTAPDIPEKAFVEWQENGSKFDGFGEQTITKTETRIITAKYEDALYVYFYNPEGTQIMRTEKVADHKGNDYSIVSYDVDATHKLVGWAAEVNGTTDIAKNITVPEGSTSVNVYAIIKEGYWVSFDSDGGSAIDSQFVFDKIHLNDQTTPTKPGYTFDGWYDGTTKVENGAAFSSPMTLKAHWKATEVNYTVNYWQQKVTDDKNVTDAQKTYEYVSAETKKATTGTKISASNTKSYNGFTYNANNSSKDVEIAGDGTTIINVYYDRVLCTVNFYEVTSRGLTKVKTATGLYEASLPKDTWDTSTYAWYSSYDYGYVWGYSVAGSGCILLTSFDFKTAGYENNTDNKKSYGVVTECNFYGTKARREYEVRYYNQQADGSYQLVQTVNTSGGTLTVHEKFIGYDLYKLVKGNVNGESSGYWDRNGSSVKDGDMYEYGKSGIINIASNLKSYSLSYYNYNKVTKTVSNIKYTSSMNAYENYTPERPSELPSYYVFGGWYKDKACTTKFDFSKETMPNANLQIYAKWSAEQISLTYNLKNPEGTVAKDTKKVEAGTVANTVLPSIPTINEYSFAGWYYADGNGNITSEVFNTNNTITRNTSIVGKWLYKGELTVVYDPGTEESKATVPTDGKVYAGGAKVTVAKNATTTSDKKFLGWELNGNVYKPGQSFEVNKDIANENNQIILTATWGNAETSTTLTYDPGNGIGTAKRVDVMNNEAVEIEAHDSDVLGFTAPVVKEGKEYYFAGWADSSTGNATYADGQTINIDANGENVLYAVWVEKAKITVVAKSDEVTYDGNNHVVDGFNSLTIDGYTVSGLSASVSGTDADTYDNVITGEATVTKDGKDVTDRVVVTKQNGTLTIKKRQVTLTSEGGFKTYDGTPLTKPNVTGGDGFVNGEVKDIKATGSVTNVSDGEVTNTITYTPNSAFKEGNYSITKNEGKLYITVKSIIPNPEEENDMACSTPSDVVYSGNEQRQPVTVTDKNVVLGTEDYDITYSEDVTNVGEVTITVTGKGNYTGEFTRTYQITPATLTITTPDKEKVYDGKPLTAKGTITGFVNDETATFTTTGSQTEVGSSDNTYEIVWDSTAIETNYTVSEDLGTLTVKENEDEIIVTTTGGTFTYDGNPHGATVTVSTLPKGYTLETATSSATATDVTATAITAECDTLVIKNAAGEDVTGKLKITKVPGTIKITPAPLSITTDSDTKVYDGKPLTADGRIEGLVNGEKVTFTVTGSQTIVGTSDNTYTLEFDQTAKEGNYSIADKDIHVGKLTVTAQSIDPEDPDYSGISIDEPIDVTYDGEEHKWSPTVTDKENTALVENVDYTVSYNTENFINIQTIVVTIKGTGNYSGTVTRTYRITPATVTVTANDDSKVYGEADPKLKATVTGTLNSDTVDYTLTRDPGEDVGEYTITPKGEMTQGNYIVEYATGTFEITPRSIKPDTPDTPEEEKTGIKVNNASDSIYNGQEHKFIPEITNKDGNTLVEGKDYEVSYSKDDFTNVTGEIVVTIKGKGNYTGEFTDRYQITKRYIRLSSKDDGKEYDGTPLTNTVLQQDSELTFVEGEASAEVTGTITNKGSVPNTITVVKTEKYKEDNYDFDIDEGTLTITAKEVKVTANNANKVYGENDPELKATVTGTLNNDTVDYTVTRDPGEDVGTYAIHVTGDEDQGNYHVTYTAGEFEITKSGELILTAELTGESATKVYDGNPLTGGATANVKEGTTITYSTDSGATWTTEVPSITNVGTLNITAKAENPNYEPAETTYSLTVTHATVTVTAENKTKVYGTADPELTATVSGTLGNDTVAYTLAREAGENAGKYKITVTGEENQGNYKVTYTPGTFEITPKTIVPDGPETPEEKKTGIEVTEPEDSKYDGEEHKNTPTVADTKTGKTLTEGTDYTLTYSEDVTNAGKVTVTVTGIGNYTGEFDVTYEITKRDVVLTSATDSKPYDGTALRNENVEVTGDGFAEGEGATFAVIGTITNVGTKANTFGYALNENTLASNYNISTKLGTLTITPKSIIPDGPKTPEDKKTGITVENPGDVKYDGKDHAEKPVIKDEKTGVTLEEGKDYEIVYPEDIKNAGEITATVVGKGDYEGSFEIKYNITKRDVTFTSATDSKQYDGNALTNGNVEITGDGFIEGEGAEYKVTGTQTQVGNSANEFEYTLNENTLASNYDITKVVGTLTVTAAPAPETPEKPKPEVKKSVDTFDDNNTVFYGNAFFMAMITLAGIIVLRKKSS